MASPAPPSPLNPLAQMAARIANPQLQNPHAEPASTKKGLFEVDAVLATSVASWLKKRGKVLRPKLSEEQRKQLAECFELMDADGSGAIDADELGNAFKLLGLNVKKHEIVAMLDEVDRDGSGEVEYLEFVEIMTTTLHKLAEEKEEANNANQSSQVPFALMATAYRRKRIMESLISGDKDMTAQIAQMGESKRWEEEEEKQAAQARALEQAQAKASQQASMDSMESLIAPAVARALSRMKSRPGPGRSVAGLVDVVDDGEECELTLMLRQRTQEHLDARAASEQVFKQLPSYNNFRESPSHKMLMHQLDVQIPKMKLHLDSSCRSPSSAGIVRSPSTAGILRSPSRHQPSASPHSLSRCNTGDFGCLSPTTGAPDLNNRRSCTSMGQPSSSPALRKDSFASRSKSMGGITSAGSQDIGGVIDALGLGDDFAGLAAALTGGASSSSVGGATTAGGGISYGDTRVHEFQLQPPLGVSQHHLPRRNMSTCVLGATSKGKASGGGDASVFVASKHSVGGQSRSCAGSPAPGMASACAQLELMGHATGMMCNGGVLRNEGGVMSCALSFTRS